MTLWVLCITESCGRTPEIKKCYESISHCSFNILLLTSVSSQHFLTQVILEAVPGLVLIGKPRIERGSLIILQFVLDCLCHGAWQKIWKIFLQNILSLTNKEQTQNATWRTGRQNNLYLQWTRLLQMPLRWIKLSGLLLDLSSPLTHFSSSERYLHPGQEAQGYVQISSI